jgi:FtsZ-binding cell division protein ZapB
MTESNITPSQEQENKKGTPVFLIVLTVFLALGLAFLVFSYFGQKKRMIEMETVLTQEKDSLANELRLMVHGYDTLRSNNDTLNAKLGKERSRIVQLLSINASNLQLVKSYKAEIGTMRNIMKSYIVQIDSLNTRNKILAAENIDIKQQRDVVQQTNVELSKVKEELSTKVEIASVIQAKDVVAVGLLKSKSNKNPKETTRLDRIDKIRVCFTLRANPIAKAGPKVVYLRIMRPDSLVITSSPENLFDFNSTKMIYTAKREADYLNQDIDLCIFVNNTGDFIIGNYKADLYLENNLIGGCTFMITKK